MIHDDDDIYSEVPRSLMSEEEQWAGFARALTVATVLLYCVYGNGGGAYYSFRNNERFHVVCRTHVRYI